MEGKRDPKRVVMDLQDQLLYLDVTAEPGTRLGSLSVDTEDAALLREAVQKATVTLSVPARVDVILTGYYVNGRFVVTNWEQDTSITEVRPADIATAIREQSKDKDLDADIGDPEATISTMPVRRIHFDGQDF